MLSYRHGFHAGNFADVFKHFLLVYLLKKLKNKKPFSFIDAFAGAGKYFLNDPFMKKNKEYLNGITKVLSSNIKDPFIKDYLDLVKIGNFNNKTISFYPGSCLLSLMVLDKKDKIYLSELHNNEFTPKKKNFEKNKNIKIEKKDAYSFLNQIINFHKGNKLILIDPSYEVKNEYEKIIKLVKHNTNQFPSSCFLIWYPVLESEKTYLFIKKFINTNVQNLTHINIQLKNSFLRMQGTGFFIVNAPSNMKNDVSKGLETLLEILKDKNFKAQINFNTF